MKGPKKLLTFIVMPFKLMIFCFLIFTSCSPNSSSQNTNDNAVKPLANPTDATKKTYKLKIGKPSSTNKYMQSLPLDPSYYAPFAVFTVPVPVGAIVTSRNSAYQEMTDYRNNYVSLAERNLSAFSFRIKASILKDYLDACNGAAAYDIQSVRLSLGEISGITRSLKLFVIALDKYGQHVFLDDGASACHILYAEPVPLPAVTPNFTFDKSANDVSGYYHPSADARLAEGWISEYRVVSRRDKFDPTHTWLYDMQTLRKYINNGAAGHIDYLEFNLAKINGKLTLIIVGIDQSNKHMMFKYGPAATPIDCVLENANPCPYCLVDMSLESCN